MGSRLRTILEEIRDQIATNAVGSGSYDNDLRDSSSTERVFIGTEFNPLFLPAVQIIPMGRPSSERGQLTQYDRTLSVLIVGMVQATTDGEGEALLQACDLADDIELALETDYSLGGNVNGIVLSYDVLSGAEYNLPGSVGVVQMTLTASYHETRGS